VPHLTLPTSRARRVVDSKVLVIHGGLFGRPGVTLQDLAEIDRLDYCPAPPPEPEPTTPEEERAQDLRQLMRDCLCESQTT